MAATNKCLAHFNKSGMQAKATKKCVADITATDLARPNGPPPHHALAALEDRSMSEESNKQCSICFRGGERERKVAEAGRETVSGKAPRGRKAKKAGRSARSAANGGSI
jgi:hypothetical protein